MRTILSLFCISGVLALLITPLVERAALALNFVDPPADRKMHSRPIPRLGGVAIFLAFFLSFVPLMFYQNRVYLTLFYEDRLVFMAIGGLFAFALGLTDDIRRLRARTKFVIQIGIALIPVLGGIRIHMIDLPGGTPLTLEWMSIPMTVFWILLVTNAINLIDGLDGLAAGVSFFVCMTLLVIGIMEDRILAAVMLASLSGAILGFLRYNFNPASIFMGDSGSYFLGFMLATLSVLSSMKTHAAASILIPIVALGLPLMDTVWAAVRRFILGQGIFLPDRDHVHHRLVRIGYSHRRAVLMLYSVTVFFGLSALVMVYWHDARNAMLLFVFAFALIVGIHRLGYFNFLDRRDILNWAADIYDQAGFSRDRRQFLSIQVAIAESRDLDTFRRNIIRAAKMIHIDYIALDPKGDSSAAMVWSGPDTPAPESLRNDPNRPYMRIPLEYDGRSLGALTLSMDMAPDAFIRNHTLQRVELLRRNIARTLAALKTESR